MTVLLPASFRGVPFEVDATGGTFGRRTAEHEFPQRDMPYTEDLGRAKRELRITGYVSGAAYAAQRDALIRALEQEGPGTLIHPHFGVLLVHARPAAVSESKEEMDSATFELVFVESGMLLFPLTTVDVASAVDAAAEAVAEVAAFDFEEVWDVVLKPGNVVISAIENVRAAVRGLAAAIFGPAVRLLDQFEQVAVSLKGLESDVATIVRTPEALAARFAAIFGLTDRASAERVLADLSTVGVAGEAVAASATTPTTVQIADNEIALRGLLRRQAIARSASLVAREELGTYDDAVRVRDEQSARLSLEADHASVARSVGDDLFIALTALRVTLSQGITERAADLVTLRTLDLPDVDCSLLLAHDLYGDAERSEEIVARNAIIHPGFVPPGQILVLSA